MLRVSVRMISAMLLCSKTQLEELAHRAKDEEYRISLQNVISILRTAISGLTDIYDDMCDKGRD